MHTSTISPSSFSLLTWLRHVAPGIALPALVALAAVKLSEFAWFSNNGLSALTLAILIGLVIGNTVYPRMAQVCTPGINISKQKLLRTGIVLYGLRVTFQDIAHVGWEGVAIDAIVLCSTFGLACVLGQRLLGLDKRTTILVGAGSSICGAAAVLATAPVAKARPQDVAVAIATVVTFGSIAMFLYPALYHWNLAHGWLPIDGETYGLYVGATVHEVAQVVAAGLAVSPEATGTAVIAKMVRVMMLAPFLMTLAFWLARDKNAEATGEGGKQGIVIPWFALGFLAVAGINSLNILPAQLVQWGVQLDNLLLAIAMAALGLTTHAKTVRAAGIKPLLLALILFAWLIGSGLVLTQWLA